MTLRVERKKWILYRHTNNFKLICAVADFLKNNFKSGISDQEKTELLLKLKEVGLYNERNHELPLDAINHRINTLAYYMFGYKDEVFGEKKFLFSPLGNLFLKNISIPKKLNKIFLTMLWAVQYPHPHGGTDESFKLYPFRLIFKLLTDERLDRKLFAYEVAYLVVFTQTIDENIYNNLVNEILKLRNLSNEEIEELFKKDEHAYVNATYERDYYVSSLFQSAGIIEKIPGEVICKLLHGTNTYRNLTRNTVVLKGDLYDYCLRLLESYSYDAIPLDLNDSERLNIDVVKEIYSFYPSILLSEIGESDEKIENVLDLPKLIEQYANNNNGEEAYLFEEKLTEGFNMFYNVEAKLVGGAGKTDIECLYLTKRKKFAVDAKSTKNKLSGLNAGRLESHRNQIGGEYTIVVTPRYVPAVKHDIRATNIVIILASTFSEYLYNNINANIREIDYEDFDNIIINNLGTDISSHISSLTLSKFGVSSKP